MDGRIDGWVDRRVKQVRLACMDETKPKRFMKIIFFFLIQHVELLVSLSP